MHILTFRVSNCFGFRDSGAVNLQDTSNLITLLGKNSAGKTSFLTALAYLGVTTVPQNHLNFTNFNPADQKPYLLAQYDIGPGEFSLDAFIEDYRKSQDKLNTSDPMLKQSTEYKQLIEKIEQILRLIYSELLTQMEEKRMAWVMKLGTGEYRFAATLNFKEVVQRQKRFAEAQNDALVKQHPQNRIDQFIAAGGQRPIQLLTIDQIESLLFLQFPPIAWFREAYALLENLPDLIGKQHLASDPGSLTTAFITFLGRDNVKRLLVAENPQERRTLLQDMQRLVDELAETVNRRRTTGADLIKLDLDRADGLQVTVFTGGKASFYRQISDNTKLLFAYYLYQHVNHLDDNILLFDEPNNGFHATAQEQLLNFLQMLGKEGSLVIISTHSEYLIDPDYLSGIRLMGTDKQGYLIVRNHYYGAFEGNTDADNLALRPLTDAIGLRYGSSKIQVHDKVVITEGITDMLYLRAFHNILNHAKPLHIAPGNGDGKIPPVIALLLSQDMRFKVVVDTAARKRENIKARIQKAYSIPDEFFFEVLIPDAFPESSGSGIEDLFSKRDFKRLLEQVHVPLLDEYEKMSNSQYIKQLRLSADAKSPPKRIVAHEFYANFRTAQRSDFEEETLAHFQEVLDFCDADEWFSFQWFFRTKEEREAQSNI